jgi:chorismate synthase
MANSFGERFKILTFGESHGKAIGVVIEGVMPGLDFDLARIQKELDRRRPGQSELVSPRPEEDHVEVLSGVFEGKTLGTPICLLILNRHQDSKDYDALRDVFRPGHAGYAVLKKYGVRDHRGEGRLSGRETAARVAAGALAKGELAKEAIHVMGFTREIDGIRAKTVDFEEIEKNPLRCPDKIAAEKMKKRVLMVKSRGDSVGGIVEVLARQVPSGLGDPVFRKLDAEIAGALMSIGGVKAVEIGEGFHVARMRGSENNDQMNRQGFKTNHAGGILGGISTGQEIQVRIAVKPTPSIEKPQETIDIRGKERRISIHGRHDPCICPRIVPVAEAMVALVLYDALLRQRSLEETIDGLERLRGEIDWVDHQIIQLLARRAEISAEIGQHKRAQGFEIRDHNREREMTDQRIQWAGELGVDGNLTSHLFERILEVSREIQGE